MTLVVLCSRRASQPCARARATDLRIRVEARVARSNIARVSSHILSSTNQLWHAKLINSRVERREAPKYIVYLIVRANAKPMRARAREISLLLLQLLRREWHIGQTVISLAAPAMARRRNSNTEIALRSRARARTLCVRKSAQGRLPGLGRRHATLEKRQLPLRWHRRLFGVGGWKRGPVVCIGHCLLVNSVIDDLSTITGFQSGLPASVLAALANPGAAALSLMRQ